MSTIGVGMFGLIAAYEREVQEGRGHSGQSALIDLVAERPVSYPQHLT